MPVLELLQRRIAIAQELQSVVKTMKVLAAASIHQYERAVESLIEYTRTIEMGLQIVLGSAVYQHHAIAASPRKLPRNSHLGAIIFGSDQGMCGQFNEQIVRYAVTQIQHLSIDSSQLAVLAVGRLMKIGEVKPKIFMQFSCLRPPTKRQPDVLTA